MVERNFNTKIKVVQPNVGKEFVFLTKLGALGLQNIVTCKSQQNGVMESRNHRVVERGLALLVQFGMPLKY